MRRVVLQQVLPDHAAATGAGAGMSSVSSQPRISARPVSSPIGAAPARQSLMPLSFAGLWLAVIITPGRPRLPEA